MSKHDTWVDEAFRSFASAGQSAIKSGMEAAGEVAETVADLCLPSRDRDDDNERQAEALEKAAKILRDRS